MTTDGQRMSAGAGEQADVPYRPKSPNGRCSRVGGADAVERAIGAASATAASSLRESQQIRDGRPTAREDDAHHRFVSPPSAGSLSTANLPSKSRVCPDAALPFFAARRVFPYLSPPGWIPILSAQAMTETSTSSDAAKRVRGGASRTQTRRPKIPPELARRTRDIAVGVPGSPR